MRSCLGLAMPEGGRHREMAERNHCLRLGGGFLSVIAMPPKRESDRIAASYRTIGVADAPKSYGTLGLRATF